MFIVQYPRQKVFRFVKTTVDFYLQVPFPPNVFIYRNADLLYIVCFKIMFNKCLYINAYVQKPISKRNQSCW
jgi:hypothetical protein